MMRKGFESFACDELDCMSYNVNLDLALKLFEEYPSLKRLSIWSNTEKITYSAKNKAKILDLVQKKNVNFFHIRENVNTIHGKLYAFKKNGSIRFLAIGSPNFSEHSNQNFESLIYIHDNSKCESIWKEIPQIYTDLNLSTENTIPVQIFQAAPETKMDQKFLIGLWMHQIEVLSWIANKQFSIVNIPPGTGKTEIAFSYLRYLFEQDKNITSVVLVPTITLLEQWMGRLDKVDILASEWGTDLSNLGGYFADPEHKVIVTLYSRFFQQYREYQKRAKILKPNMLLILDECHSLYGHLDDLLEFKNMMESFGRKIYAIGLSATIDSFKDWEVRNFINLFGGNQNRFEISLQSFYAHWNTLNATPVLKPIKYMPIKYRLNNAEIEELRNHNRRVAMQMGRTTMAGPEEPIAAIRRAQWLRGLPGGVEALENYIITHMDGFNDRATIIFVQTNEIAENLQSFTTGRPGWNPEASIYVYDSTKDKDFLSYAITQFKKHLGFCLISEKMLSEGFDLPKVDRVVLHGSDKSPRDWIQKIGRAMRFDKADPDSVAEIVDVVFCDPSGEPLALERERYECLASISQ